MVRFLCVSAFRNDFLSSLNFSPIHWPLPLERKLPNFQLTERKKKTNYEVEGSVLVT
jgi:hypothetical protein